MDIVRETGLPGRFPWRSVAGSGRGMGPARADEDCALADPTVRECQGRLPSRRRSDHGERIRDRTRRGGSARLGDLLAVAGDAHVRSDPTLARSLEKRTQPANLSFISL